MLSTDSVDGSVDEVVDESNDTGRVAKEGTSTGDLVENGVESETESGVVDTEWAEEAFPSTEKTTDGETREVSGAGSVAEIVGPATRRDGGSCAFHARRCTIGQVEVFEIILAETCERGQCAQIESRIAEEGSCIGDVFGTGGR